MSSSCPHGNMCCLQNQASKVIIQWTNTYWAHCMVWVLHESTRDTAIKHIKFCPHKTKKDKILHINKIFMYIHIWYNIWRHITREDNSPRTFQNTCWTTELFQLSWPSTPQVSVTNIQTCALSRSSPCNHQLITGPHATPGMYTRVLRKRKDELAYTTTKLVLRCSEDSG